jgi:hypothetical protein
MDGRLTLSLPITVLIGSDHYPLASGATFPWRRRGLATTAWPTAKKIEARQRKIASAR